jgi:ABC-2 type transport system ATP-binding protein
MTGAPVVHALDAISFGVAPGRICAILGPNGAGKTSLLEILATVLLPSGGHASVCGHDVVAHAAAVRRLVTYAPAGGAGLFPRLSGRHNLEWYAALHNLPRRQWRAVGEAAAREFDVIDAIDRRVDTYSDGMRQRLGLARAWMVQSTIWLLDEPTRGLDPVARVHTQEVLRRIAREAGVTMLLSTHDLVEAETLCDQVVVLHRGRVTLDVERASAAWGGGRLADAYTTATAKGRS